MPPRPAEAQSRIERETWWLIGLTILLILGLSVTIPLLLLSLVRAGALQGMLPPDGGVSIVVGLVGLAAIFSLNLVYHQARLVRMRRRVAQAQIELEQSKSRLAELTSLFQLGNSLHMDLPLQTILEISVRRVASTLRAHDADVFLLSVETKSLRCAASLGFRPRPAESDVPYGIGPIGSCARTRQAILLAAGEAGPFADFLAARADTGSILFLPIRLEKRCAGVLVIARNAASEPFRAEHVEVAQLFADNLGPVLERAQAAASIRQKAAASAEAAPLESAGAAGPFQDALLGAAGQELKAPLTSIVAYAEVLDQNDKRMTPAMRSEFVGRVRGEAQRLMGLVDDVLDLVRLELGRYVLELHLGGVNDAVKEAVAAVAPAAAARQIAIETSLDETIPSRHVDPAKLRQSAVHLLRNAVRSSPAKGRVTIATKRVEGDVRVEVLDSGPALDPEEAAAIYEIEGAARGDSKRGRGGDGLGLHLAKRFVELHGGTVGAETAADGRVLFWIRLPWSGDLTPLVGADPFAEELTRAGSGS